MHVTEDTGTDRTIENLVDEVEKRLEEIRQTIVDDVATKLEEMQQTTADAVTTKLEEMQQTSVESEKPPADPCIRLPGHILERTRRRVREWKVGEVRRAANKAGLKSCRAVHLQSAALGIGWPLPGDTAAAIVVGPKESAQTLDLQKSEDRQLFDKYGLQLYRSILSGDGYSALEINTAMKTFTSRQSFMSLEIMLELLCERWRKIAAVSTPRGRDQSVAVVLGGLGCLVVDVEVTLDGLVVRSVKPEQQLELVRRFRLIERVVGETQERRLRAINQAFPTL